MDLIHDNLDTFYKIIAKLAGEPVEKVIITEEEAPEEEPITLDFKDDDDEISIAVEDEEEESIDILDIEDEDVPEKIEMPELADDDFLTIGSDENEEEAVEEEEIHFSKAQAAKEIGIDETSFNELFEDFIGESHTLLQKIDNAIANDNLQTCRNEALKFKGMSDNMRLHEFTAELETLIHSSDKDEIMQAAKQIDLSINKISKMGA